MTRKIILLAILLLNSMALINAQNVHQTIRGQVLDKSSGISLPGATVMIQGSNPLIGTSTDENGNFRLEHVAVGRYNLVASFIGYQPAILPEVLVGSGKETHLVFELMAATADLEGITVKSHINKNKSLNSMSYISARSFNVEETRRYAGGLDDPLRLASSFAGVATGGNMQDNAIAIRGNSPKGLLWRVEGVEVPNPNHFSGANVAGGGFANIISSQLLSTSDFLTGAFPAEYDNALAGVFDIRLRNGNNEKREYTLQAGFMGLDMAAEGPFIQGKNASYLFNYRYSTFGLLTGVGLIPTEQVPVYQDLSFKINLPTKKAGTFSVWGIGGIDQLSDPSQIDPGQWETNWDRYDANWKEKLGASGANHRVILGQGTYVNSGLVASGTRKLLKQHRLDDALFSQPDMHLQTNASKITLSSYVNHKFNSKHVNRTGANLNALFYTLDLNGTANDVPGSYLNYVLEDGKSHHVQLFSQSQIELSGNITANAGVHAEYFALTRDFALDPRLGIEWRFLPGHSLSFGYGKHSQLEDLYIYMISYQADGNTIYPNKKMSFSHAHHFVLGYDWLITENLRLKAEPYFQYLYDIPGMPGSSFSMINFKQDLTFRGSLENNSAGRNFGLDLTLERFIKNNFYYLVTASVFDSKYKGDDGIWRNTRYDKGFLANALFGKEFFLGKGNNNILGVNLKIHVSGGERHTPLFMEQSQLVQRPVFDESRAFEAQDKAGTFVDFTLTYRINKSRFASIWAFQLKNVLRAPQYGNYEYSYVSEQLQRERQVIMVPVISWKVEF